MDVPIRGQVTRDPCRLAVDSEWVKSRVNSGAAPQKGLTSVSSSFSHSLTLTTLQPSSPSNTRRHSIVLPYNTLTTQHTTTTMTEIRQRRSPPPADKADPAFSPPTTPPSKPTEPTGEFHIAIPVAILTFFRPQRSRWHQTDRSNQQACRSGYPRQLCFAHDSEPKVPPTDHMGKLASEHSVDFILGFDCHTHHGHLWNFHHSA
jgi:hypothetical protein